MIKIRTKPTITIVIIVTTLIIENQNSSSPNNLAPSKLNDISMSTINSTVNQCGTCTNKQNIVPSQ